MSTIEWEACTSLHVAFDTTLFFILKKKYIKLQIKMISHRSVPIHSASHRSLSSLLISNLVTEAIISVAPFWHLLVRLSKIILRELRVHFVYYKK